jgi:hypothetical protein
MNDMCRSHGQTNANKNNQVGHEYRIVLKVRTYIMLREATPALRKDSLI